MPIEKYTSGPRATRADDERLLAALRMRTARLPHELIASRLGFSRRRVNSATSDIKRADIAESGEPRGQVAAAYWGG